MNKQIPKNACRLSGGVFQLSNNGDNAKTAPVSMIARTGQPIEHPFWGRIVHDLSGMTLHKKRLPIDYCHMDTELIGYLNHFDIATGDLVVSGALIPYPANQRDFASEVIYKTKVANETGDTTPLYESSIDFGGDGIQLEAVNEGESVSVNGYQFEGPGVVVRQWPLRGVAVCPHGADMNTSTELNQSELVNVQYIENVNKGNTQMTETKPVETTATEVNDNAAVVETESQITPVEVETESAVNVATDGTVNVVTVTTVETGEDKDEEVEAGETPAATVEPVTPVTPETPVEALTEPKWKAVEAEKPIDPRTELKRYVTEFGKEHGTDWYLEGISFDIAQTRFVTALKADNERLLTRVNELESVINATRGEANPVSFSESHSEIDEKKLKQKSIEAQLKKAGSSDSVAKLGAAFATRK